MGLAAFPSMRAEASITAFICASRSSAAGKAQAQRSRADSAARGRTIKWGRIPALIQFYRKCGDLSQPVADRDVDWRAESAPERLGELTFPLGIRPELTGRSIGTCAVA